MTAKKTPLRIAQDATERAAPYLGSPDSEVIGRRCCRCSGDYDTGGECERCGVIVTEADACYLMAEVSYPACFAATFTNDRITTNQQKERKKP